jgi:phosphoserine phosphatase RsbU/P
MILRGSLSFKISFSILAGVMLVFAFILLYNYYISRQLLLRNVEENVIHLAAGKAAKIEKLLESSEKIPHMLAGFLEVSELSLPQIRGLLTRTIAENDEIYGSCIAYEAFRFDPDSLYFAPYVWRNGNALDFKFLNGPAIDYFSQDWYRMPMEKRRACWSEPYFDQGGGDTLMSTYSVPFFSKTDPFVPDGVVTIDISLEWLREYVSAIRVYDQGYAFMISSQGNVITHPVDDLAAEKNIFDIARERGYDNLLSVAADMIRGGSGFIPYDSPSISGHAWLYYTSLESTAWSLAIVVPEDAFMADLRILNRDLLLIGLLGLFLLFVIVILISGMITRPLTRLANATQQIGKGNFDVRLPSLDSSDEIGQLNDAIGKMQAALKAYIRDLRETTAAKQKIESELQIARDIQQGIIPKIFPPFPNRDSIDLYAVLRPARDVGGDLYDFFFVDHDNLCFTVGDVSGKGVPASLFMVITRTLLRARMDTGKDPAKVMEVMNNELCLDNENAMFVTLFLGMLKVSTGLLTYCNAGHNYPMLHRENAPVELLHETHGPPLGAMAGTKYRTSQRQMNKREMLLLYTDGVSEAINASEEQYSEKRIIRLLADYKGTDPATFTNELLDDLDTYVGQADQFDDITLLVLTWFMTEKYKTDQLRISISNRIPEIDRLRSFTEDAAQKWELLPKTAMNVNLMLEELVSNTILYGYKDEDEHRLEIVFVRETDMLEIQITDDAEAFDITQAASFADNDKSAEERRIGGLGIHLVRTFADDISYERKQNKNVLTIRKKLT